MCFFQDGISLANNDECSIRRNLIRTAIIRYLSFSAKVNNKQRKSRQTSQDAAAVLALDGVDAIKP